MITLDVKENVYKLPNQNDDKCKNDKICERLDLIEENLKEIRKYVKELRSILINNNNC